MAENQPNATATPNATNTAETAGQSAVQAKIAQMQAQAVASASPEAQARETARLQTEAQSGNVGAQAQLAALAPAQTTTTGVKVQKYVTSPTKVGEGVGATEKSYQIATTTPEATREAAVKEVARLNNISEQEAAARYDRSKAFEAGEIEVPKGAAYNPSTGEIRDVLTGAILTGYTAEKQPIFTAQEKDIISTFLKGETDTAYLSTEDYNAIADNIGGLISKGEASLTDLEQFNHEKYLSQLPPEIQVINARIEEYNKMQGINYNTLAYDPEVGYFNTETGEKYDSKLLDPAYQMIAHQQHYLDQMLGEDLTSIHEEYTSMMEDQIELNKQILGKAKAAENAAGHIGSMLADGYISATIQSNERALRDIASRERQAITEAKRNYMNGKMDLAWKQLEIAEQRRSEYNQLVQTQFQMKETYFQRMEQRQARIDAANQAMRTESKEDFATFSNYLLQSGVDIDELPNEYISQNFPMLTTAQAKGIYSVAKQEKQISDLDMAVKNITLMKAPLEMEALQNNLETHSFGVMSDLLNIGKSVQAGVKFADFNGNSYYGTFGDDVIEKDTNGMGYQVVTNPFTGEQSLRELGYLGGEKQQDFEIIMLNGQQVLFDKNSGTYSAMGGYGTNGDIASYQDAFEAMEPTGSYHYRNGSPAIECGQYVNDYTHIGFGNELSQKISLCDKSIGTDANPIQVGDAVVTSEGDQKWGHVAIVNSIIKTPEGRTQLTLSESNYKKDGNGLGIITHSRPLYADSGVIQGFARGDKPNFLQAKSGVNPGQLVMADGNTTSAEQLRFDLTGGYGLSDFGTSGLTTSTGVAETQPSFIFSEDGQYNISPEAIEDLGDPNYRYKPNVSGVMSVSEYQDKVNYANDVNKQALALKNGYITMDDISKDKKADVIETAGMMGWIGAKGTAQFKSLTQGERTEIVDLIRLQNQIDRIDEYYNKDQLIRDKVNTGPIASMKQSILGVMGIANQDYLDLRSSTENIRSLIQKERSGAAVSEQEVKRMERFIPVVSQQNQTFESNLKQLRIAYNDALDATARMHGFSSAEELRRALGYDVDKQNVVYNGEEYQLLPQ